MASFPQVVLVPTTLTPTKLISFCQASNSMLPPIDEHHHQSTSPSNSTTIHELPTKCASEHSKSNLQPSLQVELLSSNTQPATSEPQSQFVMIAEPQESSPSTTQKHSVSEHGHQYDTHTCVHHNLHTCVQYQETRTGTGIGTVLPQPTLQSQQISQVEPVQPLPQTLPPTSSVQTQASSTHTTKEEKVMAHGSVIQTNIVAPHAWVGPSLTQSNQQPMVEVPNGAPSDRFGQPFTTATYLPPSTVQSQLGSGIKHYPQANTGESSNEHAMQSEQIVASYSSNAQQLQQTPRVHLQHQALVQSSGQTLVNVDRSFPQPRLPGVQHPQVQPALPQP